MGRPRKNALNRAAWIAAARKLLIKKGIVNVKVEPLAKTLGVTTGSFYWHFPGREALRKAVLQDWVDANTTPLFEAVQGAGEDPRHQYLAFFGVWVLERGFDPAYDQAIRAWARTSKEVSRILHKVDADRIDLLTEIMKGFGHEAFEARMRARITYYHQVGYYALDVHEPRQLRVKLAPYYAETLTGSKWMFELESVEEIRKGMEGAPVFARDRGPGDE